MVKIGVSTSSFGNPDSSPIQKLKSQGVEVVMNPHGRRLTRSETIEFVKDLDGLVAGLETLDRQVLQSAPRLKAIARVGIGMDNLDLTAAAQLGIKVSNTPEPPTFAVAEMTVAALLCICRHLRQFDSAMHEGRWEKQVSQSLGGAIVHLIGFGQIGRRVAELLGPFEVELLVSDPILTAEDVSGIAELVPLKEGLRKADVISLHASGKDTILGPSELEAVKEGVILLNSARGSLVDEASLIEALESGRIGSVWFDSFWEEPYEGRLLDLPQAMLTPHVSTYTSTCRRAMEMEAAENILRDLELKGGD